MTPAWLRRPTPDLREVTTCAFCGDPLERPAGARRLCVGCRFSARDLVEAAWATIYGDMKPARALVALAERREAGDFT